MIRVLFFLLMGAAVALGQFKDATATGEAPGAWMCATVGVGKQADGSPATTALRGLALKVGPQGEASVAYDLDQCRMAGAWTGKFVSPMNLMSRGEYPSSLGSVLFTSAERPGMASAVRGWGDPRPELFGPLPAEYARHRGFHVHGARVVLEWRVDGVEILECPWFERVDGSEVLLRTFRFGPRKGTVMLDLASGMDAQILAGAHEQIGLHRADGSWQLRCAEGTGEREVTVALWRAGTPAPVQGAVAKQPSIGSLLGGGPAHWPESVVVSGECASDTAAAYVVDTVKLPEKNPWNAPMYVGGIDFFKDGRIAFCTFHGDVWIGSGIDRDLSRIEWKRFASGLYHPLGLRIVNGEVYVCGRDGITRLVDRNGDGEADFYEAFNHEVMVTKSFHEFVFDLQTGPDGSFYFAKAGPVKNGGRGFDQVVAHHGALLRVSADGARMETVASGLRAPNGIGCGPGGELSSGDNEGTWTPVCRLNWIKQGGFYGVVDLAHREPAPVDYDRPLCWLPKRVDNSSGGQVWAPAEGWGPWSGKMLHMSYGTCSLFGVLKEEVGGVVQGGVTKFPLRFQSGIMRARFSPVDGQLYVAGLRGWQTSALKDGCIQRVRYTGAPLCQPLELSAKKGGIEIAFSSDLDTQAAADPDNYQVEVWNYLWSAAYGSPEFSTREPELKPDAMGKTGEPQFSKARIGQSQHDTLKVRAAVVSTDERRVFLEIPELTPVMQMSVQYRLRSAAGVEARGEVVNSIHRLGE